MSEKMKLVPDGWFWRVFNQGWPAGHEESTNTWRAWSLISNEEAELIAESDRHGAYEFAPYFKGMSPLLAAAPSQEVEPVVIVHRNEAGQISLKNPDGTAFDMSKHVGESFYLSPITAEQAAADMKRRIRGVIQKNIFPDGMIEMYASDLIDEIDKALPTSDTAGPNDA